MPSSPLRVAVVCSSNQNRSMEAHNILRLELPYALKESLFLLQENWMKCLVQNVKCL